MLFRSEGEVGGADDDVFLAEDVSHALMSETTSSMAERLSAILAINGDYYGFRNTGYVMRNSLLYRSTPGNSAGDLVLYSDGRMEIINESEISAEELLEKGATDIWSFGPGLVENGVVTVSENDEVGRSMNSNPRTAIGMVEPGDRKSTRLNSSHPTTSRMPSSA